MATVSDAFKKVRVNLNQFTEDGAEIPESELADIKINTISLADTAQKKLFRIAKLDSTKISPSNITKIDDEFEINDLGVEAVICFITSRLAVYSNKELVNFYEDEYNKIVEEIKRNIPATYQAITDIYSDESGDTNV
jgi:type III secretory pathway component EscV